LKDLKGKRVLITGAADGIGRAVAHAFAREGCILILADIDGEKLASVSRDISGAGVECRHHKVDVSSAEQVAELADRVDTEVGGVDILVNVAGVCVVVDILDTTLEDWDWLLGVNLHGPINTIRAFVPGMAERRSGHVLNVASAGGLVHFGMIGGYCTTKAGLVALTAALGQEVFDRGVRVTAVCPGITRTGIVSRMRFHGLSKEKVTAVTDRIMAMTMTSERLAGKMVMAVKKEKPLLVTGASTRIAVMANRLFPWLLRHVLTRGKKLNDVLYR
jgi:short-subunit dehydrogenase